MIKLSTKQQQFLDLVLEGKSIYLSGKAGTGKSTITKIAIEELKKQHKRVVAIAPTGIAANNIGGQTIHSLFSINPFGVSDFDSCNFLRQEKRRMLDNVDVIFIDECSMLRPDILDAMNWTLIKNGCDSLYTKQLIFIGDFKQLPPVINDNTRSILYRTYDGDTMFFAKVFPKIDPLTIDLDEILRQNDVDFINALNMAREGEKSEYFRQFVDKPENDGIILAPYNTTVQAYNKLGLEALKGKIFTFNAVVEGNVKADDFNLDTIINVKIGAKIMYLANSKDAPLVNGTLGIFVSHNNQHYIRVNEIDYPLEPIRFTKKEYVLNTKINDLELQEVGAIEQYPIRLAYALSIHKSQGMTFDRVQIDLTRPCFLKSMLYVALSRVKTPEGLRLII